MPRTMTARKFTNLGNRAFNRTVLVVAPRVTVASLGPSDAPDVRRLGSALLCDRPRAGFEKFGAPRVCPKDAANDVCTDCVRSDDVRASSACLENASVAVLERVANSCVLSHVLRSARH